MSIFDTKDGLEGGEDFLDKIEKVLVGEGGRGVLDFRRRELHEQLAFGGRITVDGAEIRQVWRAQVGEKGFVETFQVLKDGSSKVVQLPYSKPEEIAEHLLPDVADRGDGVLSRRIDGQLVEAFTVRRFILVAPELIGMFLTHGSRAMRPDTVLPADLKVVGAAWSYARGAAAIVMSSAEFSEVPLFSEQSQLRMAYAAGEPKPLGVDVSASQGAADPKPVIEQKVATPEEIERARTAWAAANEGDKPQ